MRTIKLSDKNLGRKVKVNGAEHEISEVKANKQKFRIKSQTEKEGGRVDDFTFDDIEQAEEITITIE